MILDDFCLLPAWFCYVSINIRNLESLMHIANRCAPRKIASGTENPILQAVQFRASWSLQVGPPGTGCPVLPPATGLDL
jgi:hypothetical protein